MRARLAALLSILFVNSAIVAAYQEETRKSPIKDAVSKRSLKLTIPNDYNDFYSLLQPMLIQRVAGSAGNIKVRNYIKSTMESYGWIVDTQEFTDNAPRPFGAVKFANLIATLPIGKNFQSSQRYTRNRVVFACHYDSKYFSSVQFIGATDSAVPCAMLLDMAKYFHENIDLNVFKNIVRNVQFMFFDGEEAFVQWTATDSTYGSRGLVHYLASTYGQSAFDSIDLFVLLDLLGGQTSKVPNYFSSTTGLAYNKLAKIEANLVARGLLYKKQTYFFTDTGNQYRSMVEDDHIPFMQKNVPILHIIPSPFPAQWHTASDDYAHLDRKNIQDLRLIFKLFFLDILNVDVNKLF